MILNSEGLLLDCLGEPEQVESAARYDKDRRGTRSPEGQLHCTARELPKVNSVPEGQLSVDFLWKVDPRATG